MRAALVAAGILAVAPAHAEPLLPGSLGVVFGVVAGTGADAKRVGFGYNQFGAQASWQPMATERRIGYGLRWSFIFGRMYDAGAAKIDDRLRTLTMDLSFGVRVRPGVDPSRYITLRAGIELLRANEEIPPSNSRAFIGPAASIGIDQYVAGLLLNIDIHYGLIGTGPGEISLLVGGAINGP